MREVLLIRMPKNRHSSHRFGILQSRIMEVSVKNRSKAAKNTSLERLNFTQEKRKGQRFSFLFEPPKGGMGDLYVRYKTEIQRRI